MLPKIDKLRNITKLSNATVKGMVNQNWTIPFSHLKNTLMIMINFVVIGKQTREKSSLLHKEWFKIFVQFFSTWNGKQKNQYTKNTKPICVRIIYWPPSPPDISKIIYTHFSKLSTSNNEIYILCDFNINLYLNNSYIFQKNKIL